jgi:D-arabinose 1-dehydrogenase-like Zn-dependent alcohol dehydrogenase
LGAILRSKRRREKKRVSFDLSLNTILVGREMDPSLRILKINGTLVLVAAVAPLKP